MTFMHLVQLDDMVDNGISPNVDVGHLCTNIMSRPLSIIIGEPPNFDDGTRPDERDQDMPLLCGNYDNERP
jgi:hypothetical protein